MYCQKFEWNKIILNLLLQNGVKLWKLPAEPLFKVTKT